MDRRTSLQWFASVATLWPTLRARAGGARPASGFGTDPALIPVHVRGEYWPLTMNPAQRELARVFSDLIIPADEVSPSASAVGVVEFIDEWISAPYPDQAADRAVVLAGFQWLDAQAREQGSERFATLGTSQQLALCDRICAATRAAPADAQAATFFATYRDLTAAGFYSSPIGRRDLGFIGNVARAYPEPLPTAVLDRLGLTAIAAKGHTP